MIIDLPLQNSLFPILRGQFTVESKKKKKNHDFCFSDHLKDHVFKYKKKKLKKVKKMTPKITIWQPLTMYRQFPVFHILEVFLKIPLCEKLQSDF